MTPRAAAVAAILVALTGAAPARAVLLVYSGTLSGGAENPPVATGGTGTVTITVDTVLQSMHVQAVFAGLSAGNTAAHIHCCAVPPTNVGVATVTPTFTFFPTGTTSGTYDHAFDMTLASSYNAAFVTAHGGTVASAWSALSAGIDAGQAYFNIHTSMFPGGEIRANLVAAPVQQGSASRKDHAGTGFDLPLAP